MIRAWTVVLLVSLVWCALAAPAPAGAQAAADSAVTPAPAPVMAADRTLEPATSGGYRPLTGRQRLTDWAMNAFGPSAVAGSVASASWGQWVTDEPAEWHDDGHGFAQRFGAASATTAITETSFSVLSALRRQDARYYRCPCTGLVPRAVHAVKMTFLARRTDGSTVFSVAKTVSPFVGPMVTRNTLYPERYGYADGALSGGYAVLMNAGWNLAYEFVLRAPAW